MAHGLNRIFTSGIVWDPREPLPAELQPRHRRYAPSHGPYDGQVKAPTLNTAYFALNGAAGRSNLARRIREKPPTRFTRQEEGRNVLPPLFVKVDASIVQDTAQVAVTQLFWNDSTIPIKEAAFTFPLPAGCTATDFSCQVGPNKIIKGTVKPRAEAREEFKRHIRTHDTAAGLLEQDTPEIFTTTLGNIPEKTTVKVSLTYITVLKHHTPEEYNAAESTNVPQGLTLEVEAVESEDITEITSPSHVIEVKRRHGTRNAESFADLAGEDGRSNVETVAVALPSGSMLLHKDFVLDIETAPDGNSENPQAWLEKHPTLPNHKALMLTIPPQFRRNSAAISDKDCTTAAALRDPLPHGSFGLHGRKFNIWCFGDYHISWRPQSVDYTESTLTSALSWVETTFSADMGGTELLPAIQAIVQARDKSLVTDVIVLTDGETWYLDQTLDYIHKMRGLTEGRVGGGYAEVVQDASHGGWEHRVVSMAKAALLSAHLGPLHPTFEIQDQDGNTRTSTLADAKRSPADVSALVQFDRNRIYFLCDSVAESESITSVKVEMMANQENKSFVIPVTVLEKRDTMLHKLAARSMLDDLERGRSHIHLGPNQLYRGTLAETAAVRKEAEEIATKWSLLSKWTSFFLAEEPYSPPKRIRSWMEWLWPQTPREMTFYSHDGTPSELACLNQLIQVLLLQVDLTRRTGPRWGARLLQGNPGSQYHRTKCPTLALLTDFQLDHTGALSKVTG
ncbi:hypothetical protein MFIFM68171_04740 [Madurella fahalii]|uniref:VIT domain-containing protein n=1 Tax=Madurella fahalii TaxID=1157608 RepID=A0ABQ0GA04_9PEZI